MFQVLGGKDYTDVFKGSATRSHEPWVANLSVFRGEVPESHPQQAKDQLGHAAGPGREDLCHLQRDAEACSAEFGFGLPVGCLRMVL